MVLIHAFILPKASKNQIVGEHAGELKIKINAVPEDGKANAELIKFLSKLTGVPKSHWHLHRGHSSRHKVLAIPLADFQKIPTPLWP